MRKIIKYFKVTLFLFLFCFINAESQTWTGKWIWQAAAGPTNSWMCFRKSFNLATVPLKAVANIAVDSKYWLWVNGTMVVWEGGIKRGPNPNDTYYDTVNISSYLTAGKNTIAIQAWYYGKSGFSHTSSGSGGLFFECNVGSSTIISDATWKMRLNPAYSTSTSTPGYRLSESNVKFTAVNDTIGAWTTVNFDDTSWLTPVEKGTPPVAPWNVLVPRSIPQWKNSGLINYKALSVTLPYTTTASTTIVGTLPYNAQITPYFEVTSAAGLTININTDNGENTMRGQYVTKAGVQEYESLPWMNGHSVRYTIPAGVTVTALKYRETGYNAELSGSFTCNDAFFNTLWTKSQRTLYITMRDNYMDCPDRERALWWGDAVIEIGEAFYGLDRKADLLAAKSIKTLVDHQRADKTIYSPVPGNYGEELPVQMLASVGEAGFWNYYFYSGDTATMAYAYPHVKSYLSIWKLDADSLVIHRNGGWNWSDWGSSIDVRLLDNCWYYMALTAARKMAILTNNNNDTVYYNLKIKNIKDNFNRVLWNTANKHYKSPAYNGTVDDRGNGLAVVAGLADTSKWSGIRTVLANQRSASPYMEKYVLEALYLMRFQDDALTRMKRTDRYGSMVSSTSTTLWELFGNSGTYNHAWSGGPLTLLSQYAAGIAPVTPGFGTYHVFPQEGYLTSINSVTPLKQGNLTVGIVKATNSYKIDLNSPSGTLAIVGMPKKSYINRISVNGINVWQDDVYTGGASGITYLGEDSSYYKFQAVPGVFSFLGDSLASPPTGIDIPGSDTFNMYPVPVDEHLTISSASVVKNFEIFSIDGKLIKSEIVNNQSVTIDVTSLCAGVYFIRIKDDNHSSVKKFVKE